MVKSTSVGVLSLQGAISEHVDCLYRVFQEEHMNGNVVLVRNTKDIATIDALIIPGGESTTISKLLVHSGIAHEIMRRVEKHNLPIMGTCAGCVLLAKEGIDNKEDLQLLEIMDMNVERNAFGRQKESFEHKVTIKGFSDSFPAVFIRAPIIRNVWGVV